MSTASGTKNKRAELARLPDPARRQWLVEFLRQAVAESAKRRPEEVRLDWVNPDPMPLFLAVRAHVFHGLGFLLLPFDVPHCHSIPELAAHLAGEVRIPSAPAAPLGEIDPASRSGTEPLERRYDAPIERPIVFVLSPPRSGSTLLSAMLGKHPGLYAAGELFLLPFESMGARERSLGREGAWLRVGLFAAMTELAGMTEEQAEQACMRLEAQDVPVSAVYRRLQELAGNRIVIDKSPAYTARSAWLACAERVFRAPRYIHLTRHPGAVIESFVRMRFHRMLGPGQPGWDENPWLFGEKVWTTWNLNCLRFLRDVAPDRQLRVSYEALVIDPAATVKRICDFLQLPFDAGPLQPYAGGKPRALGMGDIGFFSHSGIDPALASSWRRTPPPQRFGPTTREVARELGYADA